MFFPIPRNWEKTKLLSHWGQFLPRAHHKTPHEAASYLVWPCAPTLTWTNGCSRAFQVRSWLLKESVKTHAQPARWETALENDDSKGSQQVGYIQCELQRIHFRRSTEIARQIPRWATKSKARAREQAARIQGLTELTLLSFLKRIYRHLGGKGISGQKKRALIETQTQMAWIRTWVRHFQLRN